MVPAHFDDHDEEKEQQQVEEKEELEPSHVDDDDDDDDDDGDDDDEEEEDPSLSRQIRFLKRKVFGEIPDDPNYIPYSIKIREDMVSDSEFAFNKLTAQIRSLTSIESFWCGLNGFNEKVSLLKEMGCNVAKVSEQIDILKRIGERERASRYAVEMFEKEVRDQEGKILDLQTCITELEAEIEESKDIVTNRKSEIETLKNDSRDAVAEFLSVVKS